MATDASGSRVKSTGNVAEPHDVVIVKATGDATRAAVETCDWLVVQALERTSRAVIDLTDADGVDPRAVPLLVARRRMLASRRGELAVAARRPHVAQVIRAASGGELTVLPDVAQALRWVRGELGGVVAAVPHAAARARPDGR